ncbi:hypothetical protein GCM10027074_65070 [Streptomyces deserti]
MSPAMPRSAAPSGPSRRRMLAAGVAFVSTAAALYDYGISAQASSAPASP